MASRNNPRGVRCLHSAGARHGERPSTPTNLRRSPSLAPERSAAAGERALYNAPVSEPHIRKVRPDEIEEVWRVHVASSNDGLVRRGGPARRPADAPVASDARAALASDPDGYFCAVEEGQIRGMVSALVRGRVWYLSMFFVLPGDQGRGLGRALLEPALAYGEARGAEIRCTLATLDPRAQARYVMAGMAPRWPIYRLDGDAAAGTRLKAPARPPPRGRGRAAQSRA